MSAQDVTAGTVRAFERWIGAVTSHVPGEMDESLRAAGRMTVNEHEELRTGMRFFRDGLAKKRTRVTSPSQQRIVSLGMEMSRAQGGRSFAERAMLMHGDAAIFAVLHPEGIAPQSAERLPRGSSSSALPSQQVLERDGELVGVVTSDWNWAFARALADLPGAREDSAFLAKWFHATTAFLMSRRLYAEANANVLVAANAVPRDTFAMFDRACYAELQGMPESQVLLSPQDLASLRISMRNSLLSQSADVRQIGVRPPEVENREAERYFRRALDLDPDFAEARVRLARLLELRGRHAEAASELGRAMETLSKATSPDPTVLFYLHLVAGRVDRAQNHLDAAAAHFREALVLFPSAQSALLGASQVALLRADADGAIASVRGLNAGTSGVEFRSDPWWVYSAGLGRNAESLLAKLWAEARTR